MSGLFGGGGGTRTQYIPPPPAPPPVPTVDTARQSVEEADRMRRRKGRAATLFTGEEGAGLPLTAAKTLTGE